MSKELISRKEIEVTAKIAKLELDGEQKELFYREINNFLSSYSKFRALEVGGVELNVQNANYGKHFHEDIVRPSLPQSEVLSMTEYRENGYIQVPRIL